MESDPGCFLVAELANERKIIAACCGIRFGDDLGKMGLYMVHENYRGRGIGRKIWDCALKRLEGRNIGVHAQKDIFKYYKERYGFRYECKTVVYQCFDGSKLQSEIPSIHGLSTVVMFEGLLIKVQSSNSGASSANTLTASSLRTERISEMENDTSPYEDLCASPQYSVNYTNPNDTLDGITIQKDETTQLNFNDLLDSVVDYDRRLHNREP